MKYIEVTIMAVSSAVEIISTMLDSIGIDSIAVKDPDDLEDIIENKDKYRYDYISADLVEESGDEKAEISFFLDDSEEGRAKLEEVYGLEGRLRDFTDDSGDIIRHRIVDDGDWKDKWKEFFKPARITDRITVCPTWEQYEPEEGETVIRIDPGMAFGTGTHETTSSCIILMEKYLNVCGTPEDMSVLDVGCGSGILSIAAAIMGCNDVTGVDLDPDAVDAAVANAEINNVSGGVKILQGDLTRGLDIQADMILANLTVNLIIMLLSDISKHLAEDGVFIASGILAEQEKQAKEAIEAQGLEITETLAKGDWITIAARKK